MGTVLRPRSPVQVITQGVIHSLQSMIRDLRSNADDVSKWDFVRESLEALPLPTNAFALAVNRLGNAKNYCERGEFGAARFELRQIIGAFKSHAD